MRTGNIQMVQSDELFEENIEDSYVNGEEVVLRREFVVGDVTTSLISLGQLYQLGWRIGASNGQLFLKDPSKKVEIPVHYRGKSFALRAHVRHVVDYMDSYVRTIVPVFEEVSKGAFFSWGSIKPGFPYLKLVRSSYFDPWPAWGSRVPYRTTFIRKRNSTDSKWILVELAQKCMDQDDPFRKISELSTEIGGQMCEVLTIFSSNPHGIEELGEVVEEEIHPVHSAPEQREHSEASSSSRPLRIPGGSPPGLDEDNIFGDEDAEGGAEAALPPAEMRSHYTMDFDAPRIPRLLILELDASGLVSLNLAQRPG